MLSEKMKPSQQAEEILQRYHNPHTDPLFRELQMLDITIDDKLLKAVALASHNNDKVLENVEVLLQDISNPDVLLVAVSSIHREYSNGYTVYSYSADSHFVQLTINGPPHVFDLAKYRYVSRVYLASGHPPHHIHADQLTGNEGRERLNAYQKLVHQKSLQAQQKG